MAVSKRLRFEIFKRDEQKCQYCGRLAPEWPMTVDHVVLVTLGGSDEPSNLVTACVDCNAGKSSVPADAPLVQGVADKALAWAEAMRIVAEERAAARTESQKLYAKFRKEWNTWKDWRGNPTPLDGGWKATIDQLLNAGLVMDDLLELIEVAMSAKAKDTWRYFCGCCWKRLTQIQERAAAILNPPEPEPSPLPHWPYGMVQTKWTEEDVNDVFAENMASARARLTPEQIDCVACRHCETGCCGDPICRVEYSTGASYLAISVSNDQFARLAADAHG